MKKIIILFICAFTFIVTGCGNGNLMNTPTKKVEMFLENYQTLDEDVVTQLENTVNDSLEFLDDQRNKYIDIMKKHYQSLKYDIKDEMIDGDKATVTVEIQVNDYSKIMEEADAYLQANKEEFEDEEGNYDKAKFTEYRLEKMKDVKDKVTYTLELTLTKIDDDWKLDHISESDEQKINGIYNY